MRPQRAGIRILSVALSTLLSGSSAWCGWKPVPGHIMTQWADKVDPDNPLPEYPRPQLVRGNWVNLNGLWDYAVTGIDEPQPTAFQGEILVPFCIESALSGVKRPLKRDERLWYSRSFAAPPRSPGERLILNFGAVDYETAVLVNGKQIGTHKGGYDAFSFDITAALRPGANTLVVSVLDATGGPQPRGKQNYRAFHHPGGIMYTPTSGIWQTVWLERVPENHISSLKIIPDIDKGTVSVTVGAKEGMAKVAVLEDGQTIARAEGEAGEPIVLKIPQPRLWSPESPSLYDLDVRLGSDAVKSYFGMRKISIGKDESGVLRPMLNNRAVHMHGPLDQGYWPDGIYTAPTDEALKFDLVMTRKLGFNMTRKHVKVEPARWFYWADRLGLLVWQDMPNGGAGKGARGFRDGIPASKEAAAQFERELRTMVEQHFNHPSVVWWVIFNEAWGQYDTPRLVRMVKEQDPTRIVCGASGWFRAPCGDVIDAHRYQAPPRPKPQDGRIAVAGEFGGVGYVVPGHLWVPGQRESSVYQTAIDKRHYEHQLLELWKQAFEADRASGTSAAVYTQITDIEMEVNGLLTYDRKVVKPDLELIANAVGKREFPPSPTIKVLVPTSEVDPQEWSYTLERPANNWFQPGADLAGWKKGPALFGHKVHRNGSITVNTEWRSPDLWVVRTFELPAKELKRPVLRIAYDDNATVYINGVKAFALKKGTNRPYRNIPLPAEAAAGLKAGRNTIAIHVDNKKGTGSQFIDAGLGEESINW